MILASGGGGSVCGPPVSFSVHLASSEVTPAGSVHKSRGDNVVFSVCIVTRGAVGARVWEV